MLKVWIKNFKLRVYNRKGSTYSSKGFTIEFDKFLNITLCQPLSESVSGKV